MKEKSFFLLQNDNSLGSFSLILFSDDNQIELRSATTIV
jgi:hypothetical protein